MTLIMQSLVDLRKSETGNACFVSAGFIRCMSCCCQDRDRISEIFGFGDEILDYLEDSPVESKLMITPDHVIPFDIQQP